MIVDGLQRLWCQLDRSNMHRDTRLAHELDISVVTLRALRGQALRRIRGYCPFCGQDCDPEPACRKHMGRRAQVPSPTKMQRILQCLPKDAVLFHSSCVKCGKTWKVTVGEVLEAWQQGKRYRREFMCADCLKTPLTAKIGEVCHAHAHT